MTINGITGRTPRLRPSEKALLHLLRINGALSKAELARLSNMSAQGVSIIVERLLDLNLLRKEPKQRGRVGQPSTPITLNPDGAVSVGMFIAKSSAQLVVSDFHGEIRAERRIRYTDVQDSATTQSLFEAAETLPEAIGAPLWDRHVGVGIATSETLLKTFGHAGPDSDLAGVDAKPSLAQRLEERFNVPIYCINDIRAACIAELSIGSHDASNSTLYLHLGETLGAGIILEGRLIGPETQLSSSLHHLPFPGGANDHVGDVASIRALQERIGRNRGYLDEQIQNDFADTQESFGLWRSEAVRALSIAIRAASATLIVDRVLIASPLRKSTLAGIVSELRYTHEAATDSRVPLPEISMETVTPHPRARGAAMTPFLKIFGAPDTRMQPGGQQRHVA